MSLAKTSALMINKKISSHFLILLLISVLIQIWPVFLTQPARFAVRIAICTALLLVCAAAIYRSLPGKIVAFVLTTLLSLNYAIAYSTWSVYQSEFNTVFAMSILGTHLAEAKSMSGLYLHCLPAAAAYCLVTWYAVKSASEHVSPRVKAISFILLVVYFGWYSMANWLKKRHDLEVYYPLSSRILTNTPFYTGAEFIIAHRDNALAQKISHHNVNYPSLQSYETGIENYVVIVGESARRSNMQLYGFNQDTTPVESGLAKDALIFSDAIAPASATVLSVPMILSKADPDHFTADKLADNIISVAKKTGYHTEWISAQGNTGKSNNYIVAIASISHKARWIDTRYDTELLPALDEALKAPGKKLIFLHINGSHEMACDRFPASAKILNTGNQYEDCYNNAILFTDFFIGEVAKRLQASASSLLYLSDHGLEKNPQLNSIYMHGSRNPSKEAYQVPLFIWYSQQALNAQKRAVGWVHEPWPTASNYELMLTWLGITTGVDHCSSVLEVCYQSPILIPVIDGGRHIYDYDQLRDTFSSPDRHTPWRKAKASSL
ncbi:phosphoethanolamine transferase [Enterobacter cloacae]|uniref:Membrane protein n=2 Tax=Enterobacter cloacae TaxID=550 RepID=A0AAE2JQ42_ENTCL|nr:phosphoethanolamine transferase [Enterobacter cloacae]EGQ5295439.1 phosphoethanolamine transferase [Enterobacter cloacae]EKS9202992.1 phosphoethanolamine transferase [Enterobacter cloacae]EKV5784888.1 phosphoethanolamine transferase [Enterobacter cloacae]EKX4005119.1 phosphoethanolamine transferase [Enterobacter cloacae]EKX4081646.1 phosphoethanolamine transferase [Enterobacter cloacae]